MGIHRAKDMITMGYQSTEGRSSTEAAAGGARAPTLAGEHAELLRQVTRMGKNVLAVTDEDRWPERELRALADYLRAEVIRQIRDEERLLFPAYAAPDLARLNRDHVRLRACIDAIESAAAGQGSRSPALIATTTRDLLDQLERHFSTEQTILTRAGTPATATTALGAHPHDWYPLIEGPVIDVDALPAGQMIDAVTDRLRRLGPREQVELRSGSDLDPLCRHLAEHGGFGITYLDKGLDGCRVQVTRRPSL
jgi:hypothetical protein